MDKIFERAISFLVEKKIDQYTKVLEKTLESRLGEIIQQMLQKNASRIADFFSERLAELINSLSFPETIDALIHDTFHLQIQGIIESENDLEKQKEFLDKMALVAQITPTSDDTLDAQIRAQNHLNSVTIHGGREAFFKYLQLKKFNENIAASSYFKQCMTQQMQLTLQGKDPCLVRRSNENALYSGIAENLLNLMAPTRKKIGLNGEIEEINPFVELWDRLYVPEAFYALLKHSEELTQEFIIPETTELLKKIKQPAVEIIKSLFQSTTKDLLQKQLEVAVRKTFEKITIPENLNLHHAEKTFPNINSLLVETFSKQELGRNLSEFIPLFHKLITSVKSEHDKHFRMIQQTLIRLTKSKFHQFNPEEFYSVEKKKKKKMKLC